MLCKSYTINHELLFLSKIQLNKTILLTQEATLNSLYRGSKKCRYIRSRHHEFIPSVHCMVLAAHTTGRMLPDMHNSSQNIADNCQNFFDDASMPSYTYRSLPYLALTKQFRIQITTVKNGFDLINLSQ